MAKDFAKHLYASKAWRECRSSYIASVYGLCETCKKKNIVKPGKILHHTVTLDVININNPDVALNHELLEFCCQECHNRIHMGNNEEPIRDGLCFDENGQLVQVVEV